MEPSTNGRKGVSYHIVNDSSRILGAHKFGFSVANLADGFNVNRRRRALRKTACGAQKPIATKYENKLIDITPKRQSWKSLFAIKNRYAELFLVPSVHKNEGIRTAANITWYEVGVESVTQEGASRLCPGISISPCIPWRSVFILEKVYSVMSFGKFTKKSFVEGTSPKDLSHPSKKILLYLSLFCSSMSPEFNERMSSGTELHITFHESLANIITQEYWFKCYFV